MNTQLVVLTRVLPKPWRAATRCFGTPSPIPPSKPKENEPQDKPHDGPIHSEYIMNKKRVGSFAKRMLVLSGHYKKVEDVPDIVPISQFERSSNILRLYVGISLTILSAVMLFTTAISARNAPKILESDD